MVNDVPIFIHFQPFVYPTLPTLPNNRRRRVRFAQEEGNVVIPNKDISETAVDADFNCNKEDLWYTQQDLMAFQQEASERASELVFGSSQQHKNEMSQTLRHVYQAFQQATTPAQVKAILSTIAVDCLDESVVGLERTAVPTIAHDYWMRRQALFRRIGELQSANSRATMSLGQRQALIQKAVRAHSRVTRLYARYTAHVAAGFVKQRLGQQQQQMPPPHVNYY